MSCDYILAQCLKEQGVKQCYGILGIPVIELAMQLHTNGVLFYAFRNEQAASYAAGIEGYLSGRPGICITVSGPGFTNALSGMANAKDNSWPMILISGSSENSQLGMGAFQEFPQVESAREFCKWSVKINCIEMIPRVVERAFRISMSGKPGPVYIDMPADILRQSLEKEIAPLKYYSPSLPSPCPEKVAKTLLMLKGAKRPLVIIGKGSCYAKAEKEVNEFVKRAKLPFLPTPMGKGMISDEDPQCVNAARSTALGKADVVLLLGARLNWILHYGQNPRYSDDVKFINVNIDAEELGNNVRSELEILSDIKFFLQAAIANLGSWEFSNKTWWDQLNKGMSNNAELTKTQLASTEFNYYKALSRIGAVLPKNTILITEGSNTMDIARTVIHSSQPRSRLDAGSFGTMGMALGSCIASKVMNPTRPVVAIVGDSSFGFSAMEAETITRYGLDILIFVVNNNGVMAGVNALSNKVEEIMPNSLNPTARYELLAEAFGGKGYVATTPEELEKVAKIAMNAKGLRIVNVRISPNAGKKPQQHFWLSMGTPKI